MNGYIFVLRDNGQDICDECKLEGEERLEPWENFLNADWGVGSPAIPGFYPVILNGDKYDIIEARSSKSNRSKCVWVDEKIRTKVKLRWSLPLPSLEFFSPLLKLKKELSCPQSE